MPRNRESALQTKVFQVVFGLGLFVIVAFSTKSMMFGSTMLAKLLACGSLGSVVVFTLDKKYWILSAFLFGFLDQIPHLKFTGAELGSLLLVSVFFVRMALRRDQKVLGSRVLVLAAVPFLGWMCLVWSMNPTGMNMFGSSTIGGRFYFKVILSFLSMCCLSSMAFSESESKLLLVAFIVGNVVCVAKNLVFGSAEDVLAQDGTHYQFAHLSYVASFILCRYSASEILSLVWPFFSFASSFLLVLYSGNRHSFGQTVLVGLLVPFLLRRDRIRTMFLVFVGLFLVGFVVAGQGHLWRLPYGVQRSLSFLPGRWDSRLENYGFQDQFRATLRMYAKEHIRENPWFGDGGFSIDLNDAAWNYFTVARSTEARIYGHAITRNWHNVWLGMAADFGIPLSVAWALFIVVLLFNGFRWVRSCQPGTWSRTACAYFYLIMVVTAVDFFFNGGHTAKTPERFFLWTGMLCAVHNGVFFLSRTRQNPSFPS